MLLLSVERSKFRKNLNFKKIQKIQKIQTVFVFSPLVVLGVGVRSAVATSLGSLGNGIISTLRRTFKRPDSSLNCPLMISENIDDEDYVVFLEERNVGCATSDLPHLRSQCVKHKFEKSSFVDKCGNCYCYICNILASDCTKWSTHCEATNEGPTKNLWKKFKDDEVERRRIADGKPMKKRKTMLSYFSKVVPSTLTSVIC